MQSDQGPQGGDRKFEKWTLSCPTENGNALRSKTVEVVAHPYNGSRGNHTVSFRAKYDGIGFEDTDIVRLRERLEEFHLGMKEEDYEKVLVIETSGGYMARGNGEEFGIRWRIGWRVEKLGFVFDENRKYKLDVVDYTLVSPDGSLTNAITEEQFRCLVIPWTEEREESLKTAAENLRKTREKVKEALQDEKFFTKMLDTKGGKLLTAGDDE